MSSRDEQRILLTQAAPGMILAHPVLLPNKVVLCARGAELSDTMITRLMNRGIKRVHVQGQPIPGPNHDDYQRIMQRLHQRFDRVRQHPLMARIERIVEQVAVKRL